MKWDTFVSYASESRESAVIPFAYCLYQNGLFWTWFDQRMIAADEPVAERIFHGLEKSWTGVVFATRRYFEKYWTMEELRTLERLGKPLFVLGLDVSEEECEEWIPNMKEGTISFVDVSESHPHSYARALIKLLSPVQGLNFQVHPEIVGKQYFTYDCLHLYINRTLGLGDNCQSSKEIAERNSKWLPILHESSSLIPRVLEMDENWVRDKGDMIGRCDTILTIGGDAGPSSPQDTSAVAQAIMSYAIEKLFMSWLDRADLVLDVLNGLDINMSRSEISEFVNARTHP